MQQLPSDTSKSLIFLALPRDQECQSRVLEVAEMKEKFLACLRNSSFALLLFFPFLAIADSYGAIAYDPDSGDEGWNYGSGSRDQATQGADNACHRQSGNRCNIILLFKNSCGALAEGTEGNNRAWGTGVDVHRNGAEQQALDNCNFYRRGSHIGNVCKIRRWVCSSPGTGNVEVLIHDKGGSSVRID
jgi:hypothetical protein